MHRPRAFPSLGVTTGYKKASSYLEAAAPGQALRRWTCLPPQLFSKLLQGRGLHGMRLFRRNFAKRHSGRFSWSPCKTFSSDMSNRCFRIMSLTISRVGLGGRPVGRLTEKEPIRSLFSRSFWTAPSGVFRIKVLLHYPGKKTRLRCPFLPHRFSFGSMCENRFIFRKAL